MSNEDALKQYNVKKYRTPDGYTIDFAVFKILPIKNEEFKQPVMDMKIMLIQCSLVDSKGRPNVEAGKWALPGGFADPNETAIKCAKRELMEETGVENIHLEHFGVYDKLGRDPRGFREVLNLDLAFDHTQIIGDAIDVVRKKVFKSNGVKEFLPAEFTYSELQAISLAATDNSMKD